VRRRGLRLWLWWMMRKLKRGKGGKEKFDYL
jgi:hypothetical protein